MSKLILTAILGLLMVGCAPATGSSSVDIQLQWAPGAQCYVGYQDGKAIGISCIKQ